MKEEYQKPQMEVVEIANEVCMTTQSQPRIGGELDPDEDWG